MHKVHKLFSCLVRGPLQDIQYSGKNNDIKSSIMAALHVQISFYICYLRNNCHKLKINFEMDLVEDFNSYRSKMNEKKFAADNLVLKRFFNLDTNAYAQGQLEVKTKEMIGLACSMVLRCDDCVKYHLQKCKEEGLTNEEVYEVFSIASIIGGSIVIPHLRRAVEFWEALSEIK